MTDSEPTKEHKGSLATLASSTTSYVKGAFPSLHADRDRKGLPISEAPRTPKTSRWVRASNHMKKWWWGYFLMLVGILAIVLSCLFTVIIPSKIQEYIDEASLPVLDGSIEAVSANQIRMGLVTQVSGPSALTVRLDAFDLQLSNVANATTASPDEEHPATFLTLHVPAVAIHGPSDMTIDPQTVDVQNHTELSTFLTRAFAGAQGSVRVRGTTTARLGLLAYPARFDKVVSFDGLRGLAGTNVTDTQAVVPADETDGSNIQGTLMIPNTSPFTLSLGNTTCYVVGMMGPGLLDGYMGNTTVRDLVIRPGNQTVAYRGQLDVKRISASMLEVPTNRGVMESGLVQIAFRGNQTVVDGEHIGYLDDVLHKIDVFAEVPIEVGMQVMWGSLANFDFDFDFDDL